MDTSASSDEVRLRKGESFKERLILAGVGLACCLLAIPDFVAAARSDRLPLGAIAALLIGCLLLAGAIFRRNVVWIITPDGILIGEQSPFGRLRSRMVRSEEISQMHLRKDDSHRAEFRLAFTIGSGDKLTSPPLPDVTQVYDTTVRVARLLALPEPGPADNPLDAVNPEIRLGKPVKPKTGEGSRLLIVLLACVLSVPFAYALWRSELSVLGATVWTLGIILAVVLFRYADRMSGTHWIIGGYEIRVERLSLKGKPEMETIGGGDVEAIDVQSDGESDQHVIIIRLRDDRKIRSPGLASKNQAEALRGEIVRRLNISPGTTKPTG
jgi:hypothetical protein